MAMRMTAVCYERALVEEFFLDVGESYISLIENHVRQSNMKPNRRDHSVHGMSFVIRLENRYHTVMLINAHG